MSVQIPDFDERQRLADEVRRLLRAVRMTSVGDDERAEAIGLLAQAAEVLERDAPVAPLWNTGLTNLEAFDPGAALHELFPFSPSMGVLNPASPSVELTISESGVLSGEITFEQYHNGPPFDVAHGGTVALVYDEFLGMAGMLDGGGGFTANLSIDYRRPTPLLVPVQVTAWSGEPDGRKITVYGEMRHEGELLTEARGLFVNPGIADSAG